jgi:hypothetical protein
VNTVVTNTTVDSNLNRAVVGDAVTFATLVIGSLPSANIVPYHRATLIGSSDLNGLSRASVTTSTVPSGGDGTEASSVRNLSNSVGMFTTLGHLMHFGHLTSHIFWYSGFMTGRWQIRMGKVFLMEFASCVGIIDGPGGFYRLLRRFSRLEPSIATITTLPNPKSLMSCNTAKI